MKKDLYKGKLVTTVVDSTIKFAANYTYQVDSLYPSSTNALGWVQDNFKDKPPPSIIDGPIAGKEGMHRVSSSYYQLNCS